MNSPKVRTEGLKNLFQNEQGEKEIVKALIKRLNDKLSSDPKACKKAALILEAWINQKPKK